MPYLRRYLDEMKGVPVQDLWADVKSAQISKNEDRHFPTQKPLKLLCRIIGASTNEDDVVLDPFCGSGTTLVAAEIMHRRWLGIDNNLSAISLSNKRLQELRPTTRRKSLTIQHTTEPLIFF
jgi:DNA modification methylase